MRLIAPVFLMLLSAAVAQTATPGGAAPDFTLMNQDGKPVKLSDFKGKTVVLEWYNKDCPFVKKHYGPGNMQTLQETYRGKGVVWLSIISSAPGSQGYLTQAEAAEQLKTGASKASSILTDADGTVGRLYGAKTTPHMYLIDPKGTLAYAGAIDDKPSAKSEDIKGARNYVAENLDAILAGKPVTTTSTKSYGCSVKYPKKT